MNCVYLGSFVSDYFKIPPGSHDSKFLVERFPGNAVWGRKLNGDVKHTSLYDY